MIRTRLATKARRVPGWRAAFVAALLGLAAWSAAAADTADAPWISVHAPQRLAGVLERIKASGVVRIGFRERAVPFSFAGPGSQPYGYSIDLCQAIVEDVAEAIGVALLRTEYRRVTPADRIDLVAGGQIDLECGATSNTAERRERVAFSPLIFVAGTRLLVRRGGPVQSIRDLQGRRVVAVRATTNETALRQLASSGNRSFAVTTADDHAQALALLAANEVDALAADDILLAGALTEPGLRQRYALVGELLSYEAYGIMFAKDDAALAAVVEASFRRLAATRQLRWIYDKWFLRTLPGGARLGLPMSVPLERSFELLGMPGD